MDQIPRCPTLRSGKVLTFFLVIFACALINLLLVNWAAISIVQDTLDGIPVSWDQAFAMDDRQESATAIFLLTFAATAILFMVFVASVVRGAYGSGAEDMKSTPGMAAGSFFIPFYNLYGPYAAMQESWRATLPGTTDSYAWHAAKNSMLIRVWWWTWLLSRLLSYTVMRSPSGGLEELLEKKHMVLACNLFDLVLTVLAIVMVRAVSARVELKWAETHGARGLASAKVVQEEVADA